MFKIVIFCFIFIIHTTVAALTYDIEHLCEGSYKREHIAHPFDCRIYYTCSAYEYFKGKIIDINQCPYNTYFNKYSSSNCAPEIPDGCQTAWGSKLEIELIDLEATTTTATTTTTTATTSTTTPRLPPLPPLPPLPKHLPAVTPRVPANISDQCFGKADNTVHKKHDGDCRSYVICLFGQSHSGHCPIGYSFNDVLSICDTENNVYCADTEMCPPSEVTAFEKIGSCSEYYLCVNGTRGLARCAAGLQFDRQQNRCDLPSVARCFECPFVDDVNAPVTYPGDTLDTYRMCFNGQTLEFYCARNLLWNQDSMKCELTTNTTLQI